MTVICEQYCTAEKPSRNIHDRGPRTVRIGLVNNMPDAALAVTEQQFINALVAADSGSSVFLQFFTVDGIARGELGLRHLAARGYGSLADLVAADLDGIIVTGTEPRYSDLRAEPCWPALTNLFDWIERDGPSAIFSCLAAHAAVLHFDGIERRRLPAKRFGLFDHVNLSSHELAKFLPPSTKVAHSRWNEVSAESLTACGYQVITSAPSAGVNLFVKPALNPLIFFQGHPEYGTQTLLREYRRDIKRYLTGHQESYPQMPEFYFSSEEAELLTGFRARALAKRDVALMMSFPIERAGARITEPSPAACVLRAWLLQMDGVSRSQSPHFGTSELRPLVQAVP